MRFVGNNFNCFPVSVTSILTPKIEIEGTGSPLVRATGSHGLYREPIRGPLRLLPSSLKVGRNSVAAGQGL